ncbi:hypothetical protein F4677DRAFT_399400 [Hypoxylon crocopeplum]|nr:hypothetical protein F4677DRAFT_399400 [Hypoxylon crocopeplum]
MPGQFPMSNWLADKLSTADSGVEQTLPTARSLELHVAQFDESHLDFIPNYNLDSDPSSLPDFVDPRTGLLSLLPEEQDTRTVDVPSEASSERPTQPELTCNSCGAFFSSQGKLNAHTRRHEKKHYCMQCDRRFSEARDLRRHVQSRHQQVSEPCPQCGKMLRRRAENLRRHMTQYCKYKRHTLED